MTIFYELEEGVLHVEITLNDLVQGNAGYHILDGVCALRALSFWIFNKGGLEATETESVLARLHQRWAFVRTVTDLTRDGLFQLGHALRQRRFQPLPSERIDYLACLTTDRHLQRGGHHRLL